MIKYASSLFFIGILFFLAILAFAFFESEVAVSFMALLISILAIFRDDLRRMLFKPKIVINIKKLNTIPDKPEGDEGVSKYYNLNIENLGLSTLKNLKVKIKSQKNGEWLCLCRPFSAQQKRTVIDKLSVYEEDDFTIGYISRTDVFRLMTDFSAYEQKQELKKDEEHVYFMEIVSENLNPQKYTLFIKNNGFEKGTIIKFKYRVFDIV